VEQREAGYGEEQKARRRNPVVDAGAGGVNDIGELLVASEIGLFDP
jgi:hypothetical protein